MCLRGEKRGTWFNFETHEKGNMLHLIQKILNLTFKGSLQYATQFTGDDLKATIKKANNKPLEIKEKLLSAKSKTTEYGVKLVQESKPIPGTIALLN